jgi:ABC-type nickel/cobalt efflux system permease component RcnA
MNCTWTRPAFDYISMTIGILVGVAGSVVAVLRVKAHPKTLAGARPVSKERLVSEAILVIMLTIGWLAISIGVVIRTVHCT